MFVAADDDFRFAGNRASNKFIVVGVVAYGLRQYFGNKFIGIDLWESGLESGNNLHVFVKNLRGYNKFKFIFDKSYDNLPGRA